MTDPTQKQQLLEIVKSAGLEDPAQPLLEEKASEETTQLAELYDDDPLIAYFQGKIPNDDMPILRSALFIKNAHAQGRPVDRYKIELRERYGKRADIISNLCTAGYFESHIKPMYEELERRPNFSREMFMENYDIMIKGTPFAVFVRRSQSYSDLSGEVEGKIITNQRYGRKTLNIHAIGAENVSVLNSLLQDETITQYFSAEPSTKREGNIMVAQIFF